MKTSMERSHSEHRDNLEKRVLVICALVLGCLLVSLVVWDGYRTEFTKSVVLRPEGLKNEVADTRVFRKLDPSPRTLKPKDVHRVKRPGRDVFIANNKSDGVEIFGDVYDKEDLGNPFLALEAPVNEFTILLSPSSESF